ncbi:MAG: light-harvesting protein [Sphingobacteriia bacterium]|nr:light-harvesting protein [Sphingobacteriia bacterium]NCC39116.1 light-harvesting protein [Gammaproteobacteria bacterium]
MAEQRTPGASTGGKARAQTKTAAATTTQSASLSGLTEQQAREFHEQFKVTYTAFVGIAALVHLFVIASNPWF